MEVVNVPLSKIRLNKNSRLIMKSEDLSELMSSIKEQGLLQPVGLARAKSGYELSYGNRRFLATSKLGWKTIPAVIHENKTHAETDLQNLTENIQRRNISLSEAGRYIEILKKEGMSEKEIAARLGVSKNYVETCAEAFQNVPKEFREYLEIKTQANAAKKPSPGTIPFRAAKAIMTAAKTYHLTKEHQKALFQAAKSSDKFVVESVNQYAQALRAGEKNFLKTVRPIKSVSARLLLDANEADAIYQKYVVDGPFKSWTDIIAAIVRGEKNIKINALNGRQEK